MAPAINSTTALGFLRDIKTEPENDQLRLALAEWLVANGKSEADTERGRFIQQQCHSQETWPALNPFESQSEPTPRSGECVSDWLAGLPGWGLVNSLVKKMLVRACRFNSHLRHLASACSLHGCFFRRGLVYLHLTGSPWSRGASLSHPAWAWVDAIHIASPSKSGMRRLAGLPIFAHLNHLGLGPSSMGSEIRDGAPLRKSLHLPDGLRNSERWTLRIVPLVQMAPPQSQVRRILAD